MELESLTYAWKEIKGFEYFMYDFNPLDIDEAKDLSGLYNCLSKTSQQLKNIVEDIWNLPFKISREINLMGI